ncbi:hypothetical protein N7470_010411 [Penicillium chermesinum]|nr:hypothetical protein N7470_010411 [Penicillium chermesinum]
MPTRDASNAQVWTEYHNKTGGWSDGTSTPSTPATSASSRPPRSTDSNRLQAPARDSPDGSVLPRNFSTLIGTFVTGGRLW